MTRLPTFVIAIILAACSAEQKPKEIPINPNSISGKSKYILAPINKVTRKNDSLWAKFEKTELLKQEQLALDFMNWYLNIYNSDSIKFELFAEEIDRTTIKIQDFHYLHKLKKLGYLSDVFFEKQKEKIRLCNEALGYLKPPIDGNPADLTGSDTCKFLLFYEWLGGQGEDFTKCVVNGSKKVKNINLAESKSIDLIIGNEIPYAITTIICSEHNSKWLIDDISFKEWIE